MYSSTISLGTNPVTTQTHNESPNDLVVPESEIYNIGPHDSQLHGIQRDDPREFCFNDKNEFYRLLHIRDLTECESSESDRNNDGLVVPTESAIYTIQSNDLQPSGVKIENSRDFYYGDKNEFYGPLNIEDLKQCKSGKNCINNCVNKEVIATKKIAETPKRGYIWLQTVPKYNSSLLGISLGMLLIFIILLVTILCVKQGHPVEHEFRIISREEWKGDPPINETDPLVIPVPYVIIHHTATEKCYTLEECARHVRAIQAFHIKSRGWDDIGYNFLVGGDGLVYEGRGWTKEGAHTLGWNRLSVGIAFIGTYIQIPPSENQLHSCKELIKLGLNLNYIKEDYKLLGAKQFHGTESPGTALMNEIKTWEHWTDKP